MSSDNEEDNPLIVPVERLRVNSTRTSRSNTEWETTSLAGSSRGGVDPSVVGLRRLSSNLNSMATSLSPSRFSMQQQPQQAPHNIRENTELLLANIRGGTKEALCHVRVVHFAPFSPSEPDLKEKEKSVMAAAKVWLSRFASLPNIFMPTVMEIGESSPGELFLAAPRAPATPLIQYYHGWWQGLVASRKGAVIPPGTLREEKERAIGFLLRETLKILRALHNKGLAHGSIKSSNIAVHDALDFSSPSPLSLIDCGLYHLEGLVTDSVGLLASDYLPPPECRETMLGLQAQHAGSPHSMNSSSTHNSPSSEGYSLLMTSTDAAAVANPFNTLPADIWGLGITLIHLAEGVAPPSRRSSLGPKLKPSEWNPGLRVIAAKCLDADPNKRPTVEELLSHPFIQARSNMACLNDAAIVQKVPSSTAAGEEEADLGTSLQPIDPDVSTTGGEANTPRGGDSKYQDPTQMPSLGKQQIPQITNRAVLGSNFVHIVHQNKPVPPTSATAPRELTAEEKEQLNKLERVAQGTEDLCSFVLFEALLDLLKDPAFSTAQQQTALNHLIASIRELEQASPALANLWIVNLLDSLNKQKVSQATAAATPSRLTDPDGGGDRDLIARAASLAVRVGLPELNQLRTEAASKSKENHTVGGSGQVGQNNNYMGLGGNNNQGPGHHPNGGFTRSEMESYIFAKWGAVAADTSRRCS